MDITGGAHFSIYRFGGRGRGWCTGSTTNANKVIGFYELAKGGKMLASQLRQLVDRMRQGEMKALDEFADSFGPAFQNEFISRRDILPIFAAELATTCVKDAVYQLLHQDNHDPIAIIKETIERTLSKWHKTLQTDISNAIGLQNALFPGPTPLNVNLEIGAHSRAQRPINGDLYDFISRPEDTLIVLMDASGKGTAAGLLAAVAGGAIRSYSSQTISPCEILIRLQEALAGAGGSNYLAVLLLAWSSALKKFSIASAGFAPVLICRNGRPSLLELPPGSLIGLDLPPGITPGGYSSLEVSLDPGDWLAIFSDGIPDQPNEDGVEYGVVRLCQSLREKQKSQAKDIVENVFRDLDQYMGKSLLHDDQTLIFLRAE